jgi:hypothetical protein
LSALEIKGALAEDISAVCVTAERCALPRRVSDFRSAGVIEDVTGEKELVSGARPAGAEIHLRLLGVVLEEDESRIGCGILTERSTHWRRYRCAHREHANTRSADGPAYGCHLVPPPTIRLTVSHSCAGGTRDGEMSRYGLLICHAVQGVDASNRTA